MHRSLIIHLSLFRRFGCLAALGFLFLITSIPAHAQTKKDSTVKEEIMGHPEEEAYFPKFYEYLQNNLRYPGKARKDGVSGSVIVKFFVEKDGTLTGFQIEKPLSPECNAEAIRLLQNMPPWVPGKWDGEITRLPYMVTIKFDPDK